MKKTLKFLLTAFVAVIAAGCKEDEGPVDYPVTGNLNISGRYVTYLHGSQGWVKEDQIGVFVTSDGIEQANLLYEPSEICPATPNEYVEGYYSYEEENYKDGDILLNPVGGGASAGFKQGEHCVYAYTPYAEGNTTYSAVRLPSLASQEYIPIDGLIYFKREYNFAYARLSAPVSEYTSATLSLGDFTSAFVQMTIPSPTFPDALEGKTVTKLVVSADKDIATSDAVINLATGEISGTMSKSIELDFGDGLALASGFFGLTMETLYIVMCIDFDEALKTTFTFTYTIDGQEYTITGTPSATMSSDGNLNMYGALSFPEE